MCWTATRRTKAGRTLLKCSTLDVGPAELDGSPGPPANDDRDCRIPTRYAAHSEESAARCPLRWLPP